MTSWLSPDAPWPRLKGQADRALREAKHARWWFREPGGSAHYVGSIHCHRADEVEDPCKFALQGTPKGGPEEQAKLIREALAKCRHSLPTESEEEPRAPADAVASVRMQLDRLERLVGAIEELGRYEDAGHQLEILLESAASDEKQTAALLERAMEFEEEAQTHLEQARESADEGGGLGVDPFPPDDAEARLVVPASHLAEVAEQQMAESYSWPEDDERRLRDLRQRLEAAAQRLRGEQR